MKKIFHKQNLLPILLLGAGFMLHSCDFEENCPKRGGIIAFVKNDSKEISPKGYEDRNLYWFPHADVEEQSFFKAADVFKADTLKRESPAGTFDLCLYNKGTNIMKEIPYNDYRYMVLECPKRVVNGRVFLPKEQAFITSDFKKDIKILQYKYTLVPFEMRPLVKRISINMRVTDDNVGSPVTNVTAYLTGVISSKNPCTMENGSDFGTQIISITDKKGDMFRKTFYVFGVSDAVSNILTLEGETKNGEKYVVEDDITDNLKRLNDDGMEGTDIMISVHFKPILAVPSVIIDSWKDHPTEDVVINAQ